MKRLFLIVAFIILSGCATPYQPHGLSGGYSEQRLALNVYQVQFAGNGSTSKTTVNSYLLRRAAELTMQNGYRYFLVLGYDEDKDVRVHTSPTFIQTNANSSQNGAFGFNQVGNYGNGSYSGFGSGGWNSNTNSSISSIISGGTTRIIERHTNTIIIKMLKKQTNNSLDSQIILRNYQ